MDGYIVAGSNDHIVPWENAYRSTQLLGGKPRFVLSTSGHIQALINPPPKEPVHRPLPGRRRRTRRGRGLAGAGGDAPGSWWPDYVAVARAHRSGATRMPAPQGVSADARFKPLGQGPRQLRPRHVSIGASREARSGGAGPWPRPAGSWSWRALSVDPVFLGGPGLPRG